MFVSSTNHAELTWIDALHKSRLLNVEEKPFKRITKRLLTPASIISSISRLPLTPPPDVSAADEAAAVHEIEKQKQLDEPRQFREDILLDFAAFESSIVRIQFLLNSNVKERERYAAEKLRIQATAQEVRDNTADLRVQLEDSKKTLALRKAYDELAEKITNNRLLRPREDQHANLEKLNAEIIELERESKVYAQTWAERRSQFGRIIDEGMHLRRLIRDEKEEVERREGMDERDDVDDGEVGSQKGKVSGNTTPRLDAGGATPLQPMLDASSPKSLGLAPEQRQTPEGKSPLRTSKPVQEPEENIVDHSEDISMAEDGEVSVELEAVATPAEGLVALEKEGDARVVNRSDTVAGSDQMDTS